MSNERASSVVVIGRGLSLEEVAWGDLGGPTGERNRLGLKGETGELLK